MFYPFLPNWLHCAATYPQQATQGRTHRAVDSLICNHMKLMHFAQESQASTLYFARLILRKKQ